MVNSMHAKLEKGSQYLTQLIQSIQDERLQIAEHNLGKLLASWKEQVEQNSPNAVIVIQNEATAPTVEADQR